MHGSQNSKHQFSRRTALKMGALGLSAATMGTLESLANVERLAHAAPATLPNIQFDISHFIAPARTINGIQVRFGPVYTLFLTAKLKHTPNKEEQKILSNALNTIESNYAFSPSGVFTFVSYGLPYFNRLPSSIVSSHMPRLLSNTNRFALEEAVPGPTDVSPKNPGITKKTFNVPVTIESNDVLFTIRSDSLSHAQDVANWLQSHSNTLNGHTIHAPALQGLFTFASSRLMFVQIGLPRKLADSNKLPYASRVNPQSPMWMGFADQQVHGAGPAAITTFQGNASAKFTTTKSGDYFFDGSIQHLSHVIQDLAQFYADDKPFIERCQYMFRSNPVPSLGNADQFTNGGGPAVLDTVFQGTEDATANAQAMNTFHGKHRMGHLCALQRSSRAADKTPIHIRNDGPGFDNLDVPDGSSQPKLQFSIFVPTADFFATMRTNQASLDLVQKYGVASDDNGLERFITATRRQNFLVPPRSHRAFPLVELT